MISRHLSASHYVSGVRVLFLTGEAMGRAHQRVYSSAKLHSDPNFAAQRFAGIFLEPGDPSASHRADWVRSRISKPMFLTDWRIGDSIDSAPEARGSEKKGSGCQDPCSLLTVGLQMRWYRAALFAGRKDPCSLLGLQSSSRWTV
jgi:hypothetical protein